MINTKSVYTRQLANAISIVVSQNGGEVHGSWWVIADLIQSELGGPAEDDCIARMKSHLLAIGLEYVTEGSPVAFFRGMDGELNLVDRRLVYDVEVRRGE